jgi:hypothetical protein
LHSGGLRWLLESEVLGAHVEFKRFALLQGLDVAIEASAEVHA